MNKDSHRQHLRATWGGNDTPGQEPLPQEYTSYAHDGSDLYVERPEGQPGVEDSVEIGLRYRAQEIASVLALFDVTHLSEETAEEYLALEAELVALRGAELILLKRRHADYVDTVLRYADEELRLRVQAGASFETIYRTEAEILDDLVREAQARQDEPLAAVATAYREAIEARVELEVAQEVIGQPAPRHTKFELAA